MAGLTPIEQLPACEIVTVWPAMLSVPVRAPPPFAATLNVTVPEPEGAERDTIVIQGTSLLAGQLHPAGPVTLIDRLLAPPAGAVAVKEFSVKVQAAAA